MRLATAISAAALLSIPVIADAADITVPVAAQETWAPDCGAAEPRAEVGASTVSLRWRGRATSYGQVDVDLTCMSGATRDSTSVCVSPVMSGRYAFTLVIEGGVARFEAGVGGDLPPPGPWRRCR